MDMQLHKDKAKHQGENPDRGPQLTFAQSMAGIAKVSSSGQRTITTTLYEHKNQRVVTSDRKKKRSAVIEIVDDFDKNAIRQKIQFVV